MRSILGCILALGLAVSPAVAGTGEAGSDPAPSPASAAKSDAKAAPAKTDAKSDSASLESEIEELRSLMESQASQLQQQNDQLKQQQNQLKALEEQLKTTNASHESPALAPTSNAPMLSVSPATPASAQPATPATSPVVLAATTPASAIAAAPAEPQDQGSPLQLRIGNATVIPIGFMDFTGEFRDHNAGGGIGTNFGSIPYPFTGAPAVVGGPNPINLPYHNVEDRLSMQNSRIGFRFDGSWKGAHFIGYMEADFLGNNAGNVAVSSNSNTLRSRLYWVDVSKGKWEILGGQTWSLITPGRTGISPLPGNIFFSQNIDVNYQAGLVWGRIPELRFVYHPSSKAAIAFALDNQEQYVGGVNGAGTIVLPTGTDVVNGISAPSGGLLGTGATNQLNNGNQTVSGPQLFPDVIVKVALDPSAKFHIEFGGVERQVRISVNSTAAATSPVVHQGATGGGVFANLNVQLFPGFRLLTNNFWSEGGGRYIFGQIPDVVVGPTGSLTDIEASSTVTGFEWTHKNTLIYSYYGGVYGNKRIFTDATVGGNIYGYGVPITAGNFATAINQNRSVQEGTFGFNQTLWRDAKYGAINFMGQYSYLTRDPWSTLTGQPDHAGLNMVFFNLRYTLPGSAPAMSDLR